jgi:hypothetical protein
VSFKDFWIGLTVPKEKIENIKEDIIAFSRARRLVNDSEFSNLALTHLKERLDTLPLNMIIEMGKYLDAYNQSKDIWDEMTLLFYINLSFSYQGWFRKKLAQSY